MIDHDTIERIYQRDGYRCQSCGGSVFRYGTPQLAHKVPQRKHVVKRYGEAAIHHPLNLVATCSLECNNRVQLHATKWDKHMDMVYESMRHEL